MTRYTCRITASKEQEAVKFFLWGRGGGGVCSTCTHNFTLHPIIVEGVSAINTRAHWLERYILYPQKS